MENDTNRYKVLIVDDATINIRILTKTLQPDYKVFFATSGQKALDIAFSQSTPDLILLDIQMPEINGYEVCSVLKSDKRTSGIPVIFITTKNEIKDETKGFELGAVDYITKPFNTSILKARVKTHLELKQHRDNLEYLVTQKSHQLIHADRLATLGTFSAGIAHEVNNPNTFIQGNIQTLKLYWKLAEPIIKRHCSEDSSGRVEAMTGDVGNMFDSVLNGCKRITQIISSLKAYARDDEYDNEMETTLAQPVADALTLLKHRIRKNITINVDIPDDIILKGNPQKLEQVFVNLINNAIDTIDTKQGIISVTAKKQEGTVLILVQDNGDGMDDETSSKIFNPFFTTKGKATGTGLGLSISSGIIRSHGGEITVTSRLGEGTTFTITLPIT